MSLVEKKDGGNCPVINLKDHSSCITNIHFKIEGLHSLKFLLQEDCIFYKINLNDAYFSIPLHELSKIFVRFLWPGSLYELLCLWFGLVLTPRIFTKLLNIPRLYPESITWKVLKYGVFSDVHFPIFEPENTPYLDTFTQIDYDICI